MRACFFNQGNLTNYESAEKGSDFIEANKDWMADVEDIFSSCNKNLVLRASPTLVSSLLLLLLLIDLFIHFTSQ